MLSGARNVFFLFRPKQGDERSGIWETETVLAPRRGALGLGEDRKNWGVKIYDVIYNDIIVLLTW